jgi:hypothetical protein
VSSSTKLFEKVFVNILLSKRRIGQTIASLLFVSLAACTSAQQPTLPTGTSPALKPAATNLVALFIARKNNLNNEIRGEIYPIALQIQDQYVDVSNDVTVAARNTSANDPIDQTNSRIIEINSSRIFVNAIKDFSIISNHQEVGEFRVEKPIVSQFTCSAIITGQGNFQNQTSLQTVFDQIPQARSSNSTGYIRKQEFNETLRTAIAVSQATPLSQLPAASEAKLAQYRQDLLALGQDAIAKVDPKTVIPGEASVESIQVVDLDRDGSPEIFGEVSQGVMQPPDPKQQTPRGTASVWLTYKSGKPQLLETVQAQVSLLGSRRSPYQLLETLDLNGDGVEEIITRRTEYEAVRFEIYKYNNGRLERAFSGAGYGC